MSVLRQPRRSSAAIRPCRSVSMPPSESWATGNQRGHRCKTRMLQTRLFKETAKHFLCREILPRDLGHRPAVSFGIGQNGIERRQHIVHSLEGKEAAAGRQLFPEGGVLR